MWCHLRIANTTLMGDILSFLRACLARASSKYWISLKTICPWADSARYYLEESEILNAAQPNMTGICSAGDSLAPDRDGNSLQLLFKPER
jgi:hypothetical protein